MNLNDKPKFVSLRQIAREQNIQINTAYNWIKSKRVRARRRDGRWFVAEKDFLAAVKAMAARKKRNPKQDVIDFLRLYPDQFLPTTAIAHNVGISHEHASHILSLLFNDGKVTRKGRGVKSDPYIYSLKVVSE